MSRRKKIGKPQGFSDMSKIFVDGHDSDIKASMNAEQRPLKNFISQLLSFVRK